MSYLPVIVDAMLLLSKHKVRQSMLISCRRLSLFMSIPPSAPQCDPFCTHYAVGGRVSDQTQYAKGLDVVRKILSLGTQNSNGIYIYNLYHETQQLLHLN